MRRVILATFTVSIYAQSIESAELKVSKQPVEAWMGRSLVIYDKAVNGILFPLRPEPREAAVTADAVALPVSQLRKFQSGDELAQFLAHAAAHASLGHPERMKTLNKAMGILGGDRAAQRLRAETLATLEVEAGPVAAKLLESAGCGAGPCAMFEALLRAVKE
jgi:hypothetical protein